MWIKEPPKNISSRLSEIETLNFIYNHDKYYIMDNHLAAGWCWLQKLDVDAHYNFFHVDRHADLCACDPIHFQHIKENPKQTLADYTNLDRPINSQDRQKVFQYNSYILTTHSLFPNWFDTVYYVCPDKGGWDDFKNSQDISFRNITREIIQKANWIFNIDIDYFFSDDESTQRISDEDILKLCDTILVDIDRFKIITIALSPEFCGGWDKSYRIAKLMSDRLGLDFNIDELNK